MPKLNNILEIVALVLLGTLLGAGGGFIFLAIMHAVFFP